MQAEREAAEEDLKSICFVCNVTGFHADQEGIGFDKHVKVIVRLALSPVFQRSVFFFVSHRLLSNTVTIIPEFLQRDSKNVCAV